MKIKVYTLEGTALNWAVAKSAGDIDKVVKLGNGLTNAVVLDGANNLFDMRTGKDYRPSEDWELGGPIVDYEKLCPIWSEELQMWGCTKKVDDKFHFAKGPTFLVAAMRCYVSSKLGEEINISKKLIKWMNGK